MALLEGMVYQAMKCVILFASIHQVMRAEKILKGRGAKIDLIPVPREISSDCGVAIELSADLKEEALHLLQEHHVTILDCYTKGQGERFERGG